MNQLFYENRLDIVSGKTALGVELGSTRIKAILINSEMKPIAYGDYKWENQLVDGIWTYSLESIWEGIQASYQGMASEVLKEYGITIKKIGSIGFSAMMHGYLVFDKCDNLLVPFRTWRNLITSEASIELTNEFECHIPKRWSIAHLYQAILNEENHVKNIDFMTTLSGYVHWQLTGNKVIGIGDASGMFPIDSKNKIYDKEKVEQFELLAAEKNIKMELLSILPECLIAGETGGFLTEAGAKLLDVSGNLEPGIILCPPEGDAGTGMIATNSILPKTGNISAGTSAFAMVILENELTEIYKEIDLVTTPIGDYAAMIHTSNCTSDINDWISLFKEFTEILDVDICLAELYELLFNKALEGETDCGGLLSYGYFSGEHIAKITEGRPLFVRMPKGNFNLANFMRMHISSAFATMKIGLDIIKKEGISIEKLVAHGGIFKTEGVAQRILAAATETPITVLETAGEGGAWGMALLAGYLQDPKGLSLDQYLEQKVFIEDDKNIVETATELEIKGYKRFMKHYQKGLPIARSAIDNFTVEMK